MTDPEIKITISTPTSTSTGTSPVVQFNSYQTPISSLSHVPFRTTVTFDVPLVNSRDINGSRDIGSREVSSRGDFTSVNSITPLFEIPMSYGQVFAPRIDPNTNMMQDWSPDQTYIDTILQRSWRDTELKRNPQLQLDLKPKHCKSADLDKECTICGSKFKIAEKITSLPACSHTFHYSCILEWGKYKPECPLCRKEIPIVER